MGENKGKGRENPKNPKNTTITIGNKRMSNLFISSLLAYDTKTK